MGFNPGFVHVDDQHIPIGGVDWYETTIHQVHRFFNDVLVGAGGVLNPVQPFIFRVNRSYGALLGHHVGTQIVDDDGAQGVDHLWGAKDCTHPQTSHAVDFGKAVHSDGVFRGVVGHEMMIPCKITIGDVM